MDIRRILYELNLQKVAENFELYDVSLEGLRRISDETFKLLGVHRIKDKCRLKRKCDEVLIGKLRPDIQEEQTYIELKKIFGELNTAELADKFRAESIGFEDVIYLSENDLKTIGVECASERRRIIRECERLMNEMQHEYDVLHHEGISDRMEDGYTRVKLPSDIENDELLNNEGSSERMSPENGDTRSTDQGLQMNVDLKANATFEQGDRGNHVKYNRIIKAETIGHIGDSSNTGNNSSCSTREKISVKLEENSHYRAVCENNNIENNQHYEADHIGSVTGGEAAKDSVKVDMGANSTFEMNDSNNILKSSQNRNIYIKVGDNVVLNGALEKDNHSINREPLQFHSKHGRNIILSPDHMTAKRNGNTDESTDVFSSRPISGEALEVVVQDVSGEAIEVVVQDEVMRFDSSISLGFTACNPTDLNINELPDDSSFLTEREEYWAIKENFCNTLKKGDILRLYLSSQGDVFYSKNGETEIFLMAVDVSCPIWAHFRLNGLVHELKLLGNYINEEDKCQPSAANSTPSTSRPKSTPRPEHLVLEPIKFHQKCGRNISLKFNQTTAERSGNSPHDTYAFTDRILYPGEDMYLHINTGRVNDGLKIGLTVCNPEDLNIKELPNDSRDLADRGEYWVTEKLLYKTSQTKLNARLRYTHEGYVLYSVNDQEEKLLFCADDSVDLWAYFILGRNQSLEIINKDSRSSPEKKDNHHRYNHHHRRSQSDNDSSNSVKNVVTSVISTAAGIGATVVALPFAGLGAPLVGVATGAVVQSALR